MMIHTTLKHLFPIFFATCFIAALTSCGGGGSGGGGTGASSSSSVDSTPNAFTFAPITNAAVSTEVTSTPVTVSGINQSVSISVSGGAYSISGGAFTSAVGTITNGQVITVKVKSSDKTNTPVTATLTVGGVSAAFTVTTALDVTPDAFTFTPATGAGAKAVTSSNEITVTGVDVAVPVSITNGEYSVNGGAYISVAATVIKGQKIIVRATSSDTPSTDVTAVLTIGGVTGSFVVTTKADNAAPTAQILFPPPVSMTEGNTILVRGSASDEFSTIASVKVNGVLATTTDGFKNWQALVPLADSSNPVTATTENTLTVTTEDSVGNNSGDADHVAIRQASDYFPDANNSFSSAWALAIDKVSGKDRLLVTDESQNVYSIDLKTGARNIFTTIPLCDSSGIAINEASKRLYVSCFFDSPGRVLDFSLLDASQFSTHTNAFYNSVASFSLESASGAGSVVSVNEADGAVVVTDQLFSNFKVLSDAKNMVPNAGNPINRAWSVAYDRAHTRYLVSDPSQQIIFSVDSVTGARTIFSSNSIGVGIPFGEIGESKVAGIAIDEARQRALVVEYPTKKIYAVDLTTGNRSLHSSDTSENSFNSLYNAIGIVVMDPNGYAFVAANGILAVDMVTGHRVVFSR